MPVLRPNSSRVVRVILPFSSVAVNGAPNPGSKVDLAGRVGHRRSGGGLVVGRGEHSATGPTQGIG
jgi:hypothetical protein